MKPTDWIWRDGEFVRWADATTHVMTHALHYGSAVFEGIRAYETSRGPQFFRLRDHLRRLCDSAAIYNMPLRYDVAALAAASNEIPPLVVRANRQRTNRDALLAELRERFPEASACSRSTASSAIRCPGSTTS